VGAEFLKIAKYASELGINMSFSAGFNPFANQDIFVSRAFHSDLQELTGRNSNDYDDSGASAHPFKRMVDGWVLAVAIGASLDVPSPEFNTNDESAVKIINGAVWQKDIEVIEFLMSLAIAESGDPYIVDDPRRMMRIAHGFSDLGFPRLLEMVKEGHLASPTENLSRSLVNELSMLKQND
jgi:hypothetical protein